jgi:LysM repeat protein
MKMPKLPRIAFPRRRKKLHAATAAARRTPIDDYYDEEPKTNLSSAFIVVLILHVVAVGGIYTFNSIRAARRGPEVSSSSASADTAAAGSPLIAKASATAATPELAKRDAAQTSANPALAALKPGTYRVQEGDNLTKIALQHGLTVTDLQQANEIKNVNGISPGRILNIPAPKPAPKPPTVPDDPRKAAFLAAKVDGKPAVATSIGNSRTYVVVKGDTPTSIARKFGTTSTELLKFNKIDDPKKMQLGQTLKVPPKKS